MIIVVLRSSSDYIQDTALCLCYGNTDWSRACNPAVLNLLQKTTCKLLNDAIIDKLMWLKKPGTAKCHICSSIADSAGMLANVIIILNKV